jgi:hypothetical protein
MADSSQSPEISYTVDSGQSHAAVVANAAKMLDSSKASNVSCSADTVDPSTSEIPDPSQTSNSENITQMS